MTSCDRRVAGGPVDAQKLWRRVCGLPGMDRASPDGDGWSIVPRDSSRIVSRCGTFTRIRYRMLQVLWFSLRMLSGTPLRNCSKTRTNNVSMGNKPWKAGLVEVPMV